ncbi:MAG: hypothetical protein LBL62_11675 [Planctomycetaceae bacterium]|nr:hypothetical protein [Planctomycetaceae bacterium]
MNQINDDKLCCLPFWNQIASHQQGQIGYRRRNRSANGCPPYEIFNDSGGKHLIR